MRKRNKSRFSKESFIAPGTCAVRIPDNSPEAFEMGLKKWKKRAREKGHISELYDRKFRIKPSVKKREQMNRARTNWLKQQQQTQNWMDDTVWMCLMK